MFGFGNRRRFNGDVDVKLNNEYQIPTRENPDFPGALAYLELLDIAWRARMNSDEAALYIAILLFSGLTKSARYDDAWAILQRIRKISDFGRDKGLIGRDHWARFERGIFDAEDLFPAEMQPLLNEGRHVHICRSS